MPKHSTFLLCLLTGFAAPAVAAEPDFKSDVLPLLKKYCHGCHGNAKQKAGLNLEAYTQEKQVTQKRKLWTTLSDMLVHSEMPPEDKPQPTPKEKETLLAGITAALNKLDCENLKDPGRITIRRLNRAEYNNTIHDLIGVDFRPADNFPSDDVGYGFDNIGDVLSMPPLLMEKYYQAADSILDEVILPKPIDQKFEAAKLKVVSLEDEAPSEKGKDDKAPPMHRVEGNRVIFAAKAEVVAEVHFPADGRYLLKAHVGGGKAGSAPVRMGLKLNGKIEKGFSVLAPLDKPQMVQTYVRATKGPKAFAAAFLNPYTDPRALDPAKEHRQLSVASIEVVGPIITRTAKGKAIHRQLFVAEPGGGKSDRDAAREVIEHFATRAFRRPVGKPRVDRLMTLYDLAVKKGENFEGAVRLMVEAVMISPHFLFRIEQDKPDAKKPYPVDDYDMATRLSYFLWSTMPDQELLDLAKRGKLQSPVTLEKQVKRMLDDPRSRALADNFAGQWLQLRSLKRHRPDRKAFPEFSEKLRDAMFEEAAMVFDEIVRKDRPVTELLDANYTYLNEELAEHYGIRGVRGSDMQRVKLSNRRRGGVLTMAGILTLTSDPTRTNVPRRGKYVLEAILGTPPPPPPPVVPALEDAAEKASRGASLRELLEIHRKDPTCASCHARLDPLGFGLENFDAIGRWRTKEDGKTLDTSGTLPDGKSFDGPIELKKILMDKQDQFARCMTEKMLIYALGRGLEYYDECTVRHVLKELKKDKYRFSTLVVEIVKSYPFRHRRPVSPAKE